MPLGLILSAGAGLLGSSMASDASANQAQAQRDIAASQAFKPYGVSTPFGTSYFTTAEQAQGNIALAKNNPDLVEQLPDGSFRAREWTAPRGRAWDDPAKDAQDQAAWAERLKAAGLNPGQTYGTSPQAGVNRSAPVQQGTATALSFGQNQLGKVQSLADVNPETLADSQFQRYLKFVKPGRDAELDKTLGGLALSGNLGYLNNNTGTNPVIQSLQEANNRSDQDIFGQFTDRARTQRTQDINQALSLGQQGFATAGNIDALAGNTIDQGAALGGRAGVQSNAAAQALTSAAGITAQQALTNAGTVGDIFSGKNPAIQRLTDWFKNPPSSPSTLPQNNNPGDYMPAEGFNYQVG